MATTSRDRNEPVRVNKDLLEEIRAFQIREVNLLQRGSYQEWIELFADDVRYWMPMVTLRGTREESLTGERELAYFDDSIDILRLRVQRLSSRLAWTESPPSRTRYFIQLMEATPAERDGEFLVRSNFLVYQSRLETEENLFVGEREDLLRRVDAGWKIAFRKIMLDRNVIGAKNLSIFF